MPFLGGLVLGLIIAACIYLSRNSWKDRALAAETEIKAAAAQAKSHLVSLEDEARSAPQAALKYLADRLTAFSERI